MNPYKKALAALLVLFSVSCSAPREQKNNDILQAVDLVELMGGKQAFADGLDEMFAEPLGRSKYAFYAQLPDHTGNVGQFSMGNETALHIPYLYNYADQPWKTQKYIQSATLNGKPLNSPWFTHEALKGGKLVLEMGPRANTSWGIQ